MNEQKQNQSQDQRIQEQDQEQREAGATAGHPFIEASEEKLTFPPEAYPKEGRYGQRAFLVLEDNASHMSYTGTNTWILVEPDDDTCVIVDPGNYLDSHIQRIINACIALKVTPVAILLTHTHDDHSDCAEPLSIMLGVPVLSPADGTLPVAMGTQDGPVESRITQVEVPECELQLSTIWFPGHSQDSIGIIVNDDKSLLSGDVLFEHGSTVLADGTLKQYLACLDDMEELIQKGIATRFLPGHGHIMEDPMPSLHTQRDHRMERLSQLAEIIAKEKTADPDTLLDIVYADIVPRLKGPARRNIRAQVAYLRETGHPCLEGID